MFKLVEQFSEIYKARSIYCILKLFEFSLEIDDFFPCFKLILIWIEEN